MKLEIKKSDEGVEIHLLKDDGSKTVWLCEDEQAAFHKLAALVFSTAEDPKQSKRSILVGDFEPEADAPKESLKSRADRVRERLAKDLPPKPEVVPTPAAPDETEANKAVLEWLKLIKQQPPYSPSYPNYPMTAPAMPGYPMISPSVPYIGDALPWQAPTIDVNWTGLGSAVNHVISSDGAQIQAHMATSFEKQNDQMFYGAGGIALMEKPMGQSFDANGNQSTYFKVKFGKTG